LIANRGAGYGIAALSALNAGFAIYAHKYIFPHPSNIKRLCSLLMNKELPFEGFAELIQKPLQSADPQSLNRVKNLFINNGRANMASPFAFLLQKLAGKSLSDLQARKHWQMLLDHKRDMEAKLGRNVAIQTAALDYFTVIGQNTQRMAPESQNYKSLDPVRNARGREEWLDRIYLPSYYMERFKEEISRAQRYKHSLSAILLDVDGFHRINELLSHKTGDEMLTLIVKIIKKLIRNVDIIARYSGDRFLIILPNTNEREACELAERLRANIARRSARVPGLGTGVTVTLAVRQCRKNEKSMDFMRRIEGVLQNGKETGRNAVY
jgi:diguanylate cyclase (GGDEF)-like protein